MDFSNCGKSNRGGQDDIERLDGVPSLAVGTEPTQHVHDYSTLHDKDTCT